MAISFSTMLEPSDVLYADLPFALASVGFLLCQQKSDRPMFAAASGLLVAAAYLFRTAGLALFLAWIAESLIRRRFGQAAIRVAICALPVLLWQGSCLASDSQLRVTTTRHILISAQTTITRT